MTLEEALIRASGHFLTEELTLDVLENDEKLMNFIDDNKTVDFETCTNDHIFELIELLAKDFQTVYAEGLTSNQK